MKPMVVAVLALFVSGCSATMSSADTKSVPRPVAQEMPRAGAHSGPVSATATKAEAEQAQGGPVYIGKKPPPGITEPEPVGHHHSNASYPPLAEALAEEGSVIVEYTVGVDGHVRDVHVAKSSGHPRLDNAAVDNIAGNWLFHPATKNGKPIAVRKKLEVNFKLQPGTADRFSTFAYLVRRMGPQDYPKGARARHEQGVVGIVLLDNVRTHKVDLRIVHSSGYPDLDQAALEMARKWHVRSVQIDGADATSRVPVAVVWSLQAKTRGTPD